MAAPDHVIADSVEKWERVTGRSMGEHLAGLMVESRLAHVLGHFELYFKKENVPTVPAVCVLLLCQGNMPRVLLRKLPAQKHFHIGPRAERGDIARHGHRIPKKRGQLTATHCFVKLRPLHTIKLAISAFIFRSTPNVWAIGENLRIEEC